MNSLKQRAACFIAGFKDPKRATQAIMYEISYWMMEHPDRNETTDRLAKSLQKEALK